MNRSSRSELVQGLYLEVDDFADPWENRATALLIHGLAESGEAFRAWVPHLARIFKVVRLDLRGFGRSAAIRADFPWTVDRVLQDIEAALDCLGVESAHLIGAKIGGTFALHFAATRPSRVQRLVLASAPVSLLGLKDQVADWRRQIAEEGVRRWAEATMRKRMGNRMSEPALAWWTDLMGQTSATTLEGFLKMVPSVDAQPILTTINAPTLVITSDQSPLEPPSYVREWSASLPRARLEVLPGDSYHLAAAEPDRCAVLTREFLLED